MLLNYFAFTKNKNKNKNKKNKREFASSPFALPLYVDYGC